MATFKAFPVINTAATGINIQRLRKEKGLTVTDLQKYFGFDAPQAIYKWQRGETLPSTDNLLALGFILGIPIEKILVFQTIELDEPQDNSCGSDFLYSDIQPTVSPVLSRTETITRIKTVKTNKAIRQIRLFFLLKWIPVQPGVTAHQDLLVHITVYTIAHSKKIGHTIVVVKGLADWIVVHIIEILAISENARQGVTHLFAARIIDLGSPKRVSNHMEPVQDNPSSSRALARNVSEACHSAVLLVQALPRPHCTEHRFLCH